VLREGEAPAEPDRSAQRRREPCEAPVPLGSRHLPRPARQEPRPPATPPWIDPGARLGPLDRAGGSRANIPSGGARAARAPLPSRRGRVVATNPSVIRSERYGEIGALIQRDAGVLIDRWAKRAAEEQPDARRVHHDVLLDHLPAFLGELGASLAEAGETGS